MQIEDIGRHEKQKTICLKGSDKDVKIIFGVYCSESQHMLNHKEIKIKLN
jgi:hypothetical protein